MELQAASRLKDTFLKRLFPKRKTGFIILGVIFLIVVAAILLLFVFKINRAGNKSAVQQQTTKVVRGNLSLTVTGSGPITSSNRVALTSAVNGTVKSVNFKQGDQVKKGDVLVEIDDTEASRNIQQIKNNIAQMQLTVGNNVKSLGSLNMTAPFSGRVTGLAALKVGDEVQKNANILTLTDTSKLKVTLPFSSSIIKEISKGMKASVNIPDFMQSVNGTITYISSYPYTTGSGGEVYDVEITIVNPGSLKDGMSVNAEIVTAKGTRTSIDSAKLEYVNNEVMKSIAGGTVKSVNVKENQYVRAGDSLISLENDDLQVSVQTTDLKMEDLNAQLETAEKAVNDYKITSPIDGTIVSMDVVVGDELKQSSSIATVMDTGHYEFSVDIDELDIAKIKLDQKVNITLDALSETTDNPLTGKVTKIAVEGTSSSGVTTYPVTIQLDDATNIRSGMNANAEIMISEKTNVLMVPIEAVQKLGNRNIVMVKSDGQTTAGQPGNRMNQNGIGNRQSNGSNSNGSANNSSGNTSGANGTTNSGNSGSSGNSSVQNKGSVNNGSTGNTSSKRSSSGSSTRSGKSSINSQYYSNAIPTPVEIGINNDTYVEIVSGLEEGQEIILPALTTTSSSSQTQIGSMGGFGLGGMMGGITGDNKIQRNNQQSGSSQKSSGSSSQQNNGAQTPPRD